MGGAERVVSHLMTGQPHDQLRQTVCCLDRIGSLGLALKSRGHDVDCLQRRPGVDWRLVFRLRTYFMTHQIDLLHTHGESPWFYGALAANLVPWQRIPCITTIHGYGGGDRQRLESYRLWKFLGILSNKVIFVSRVFELELHQGGLSPRKTATIVNGVARPVQSIPKREQLPDKEKSHFRIGIVARLSPIKNHGLLLRAVARIRNLSKKKIQLLIVGDGPERTHLERMTKQLSLEKSVVFYGEQEDVEQFFTVFDLFVLPSFSEGISMTILEAMCAGVPVIASSVGGNVEIIQHGHNGLLFPSNDLDALVRALLVLMDDTTLAEKLAREGVRTVQTTFSLDTMLASYRTLYQELVR